MGLKYSCFVSYPNARDENDQWWIEATISNFWKALHAELSVNALESPYIDREKLTLGANFEVSLQQALCGSACMVMIYMPTYFDPNNIFCAREFRAMEKLEELRLAKVSRDLTEGQRLILPVVIRGQDDLPEYVFGARHYHPMWAHNHLEEKSIKKKKYQREVMKIVRCIRDICSVMRRNPDLFEDCDQFRLPAKTEVAGWLRSYIPKFPE